MLVKKAEKSLAKVLTQDMIGLSSVLASWISGKPYILGGCLCRCLCLTLFRSQVVCQVLDEKVASMSNTHHLFKS